MAKKRVSSSSGLCNPAVQRGAIPADEALPGRRLGDAVDLRRVLQALPVAIIPALAPFLRTGERLRPPAPAGVALRGLAGHPLHDPPPGASGRCRDLVRHPLALRTLPEREPPIEREQEYRH